ncbi:putative LOC100569746 [Trichonephila clavipes]|nr:putative LOC100569746 [Trichonephila clavipes]
MELVAKSRNEKSLILMVLIRTMNRPWVARWLEHRTPERKPWSHGKIVEVEIGGVDIYRSFWEFRRAISYCHLPPRSWDLTPLDYFLWGYVKSLVYADKPQTLDHLEDNIRRVIADIRPQMLEKVIENWTSRLDYIRASRGSPMPEIIFKM